MQASCHCLNCLLYCTSLKGVKPFSLVPLWATRSRVSQVCCNHCCMRSMRSSTIWLNSGGQAQISLDLAVRTCYSAWKRWQVSHLMQAQVFQPVSKLTSFSKSATNLCMAVRQLEGEGVVRGLGKGIRSRSRKRTSFKDIAEKQIAGPADSQLQLSSLKVCTPPPRGSCVQCPYPCWYTSTITNLAQHSDCVDLGMLQHQSAVGLLFLLYAGVAMSIIAQHSG